MKFGVVIFPGSNCDHDLIFTLEDQLEQEVHQLWHKDTSLPNFDPTQDWILLPGGFSYGDYLRAGAIAQFSPLMKEVIQFAKDGGNLLGICNGFQVLCEMDLLPGALLPNIHQKFICKNVPVRCETTEGPLTRSLEKGQVLNIPIAHSEGRYHAEKSTIEELDNNDRVLFRYSHRNSTVDEDANPNGSVQNIAGICNEQRNIFGMMPHPERAADPILKNTDGLPIFQSILENLSSPSVVSS